MPNRPITAIRKSKPFSSSVEAEGQPQLAGDACRGRRRRARSRASSTASVLNGGSLPMPTKLQKARKIDRELLGRPELQRELARPAARGA